MWDKMMMQYRIGEFAEISGVSAKTLRFYDQIGLLRPAYIDARTRYRLYLPEQFEELAAILALKALGASLDEIHHALTKATSSQNRRRLLENLKTKVEHSIEERRLTLKRIDAALQEAAGGYPTIPVVVKQRPPVLVASIRSQVSSYDDIQHFERELTEDVPPDVMGNLRGVLWHRCADSGSLEGEPFIELLRPLPRNGYQIQQLPSVTVACAYSSLDDDVAERTYQALRDWMRVQGYRLGGAKREIYLGNRLEIQFPLQTN